MGAGGGRQFGSFLTWFLQGGSVYTTYAFIAIPALVFGSGALGMFALPYLIMAYPIAFVAIPRLWDLARERGYVTAVDFVKDRFDNPALTFVIALTGIVATMPYVALQVFGIQVAIAQTGIPIEVSLWIAFVILAVHLCGRIAFRSLDRRHQGRVHLGHGAGCGHLSPDPP